MRDTGVFLELEQTVPIDECAASVQQRLDEYARAVPVRLESTTGTYDSLVRAAA